MQPVAQQVMIFLMLVLLGNLIGVLFDFYRVLRRACGLRKWGTNLGDAVFWILVTIITYVFLLVYLWGEVRLYVFIAMLMGFFIYLKLFSARMYYIIFRFHSVLSKIIRSLVNIFKIPIKILISTLLFPARFVSYIFLLLWKSLKRTKEIARSIAKKIISNKRPPQDPPPENLSE